MESGKIVITSPIKSLERTVAGDQNIEIKGVAIGIDMIKVLANGKFSGTTKVQGDGSFTYTVKGRSLEIGKNTLSFVPVSKPNNTTEIEIIKENKVSVVNLDFKDQTGELVTKGGSVSSRCTKLSIGSQVHQTNNGFCVKPGESKEDYDYADVVLDLEAIGTKVEYFSALVGLDDFALLDYYTGGSVTYQVLAGNKVLAETGTLTANQVERFPAISRRVQRP